MSTESAKQHGKPQDQPENAATGTHGLAMAVWEDCGRCKSTGSTSLSDVCTDCLGLGKLPTFIPLDRLLDTGVAMPSLCAIRDYAEPEASDLVPDSDSVPEGIGTKPFQTNYSTHLGAAPSDQKLGSRTLPPDAGKDLDLKPSATSVDIGTPAPPDPLPNPALLCECCAFRGKWWKAREHCRKCNQTGWSDQGVWAKARPDETEYAMDLSMYLATYRRNGASDLAVRLAFHIEYGPSKGHTPIVALLIDRVLRRGREEFAKDRDHLTVSGTFQSDRYKWCPAGFVPLKLTDPAARDLLAIYAVRRKPIDKEFPRDLLEALANVAEKPNPKYEAFQPRAMLDGPMLGPEDLTKASQPELSTEYLAQTLERIVEQSSPSAGMGKIDRKGNAVDDRDERLQIIFSTALDVLARLRGIGQEGIDLSEHPTKAIPTQVKPVPDLPAAARHLLDVLKRYHFIGAIIAGKTHLMDAAAALFDALYTSPAQVSPDAVKAQGEDGVPCLRCCGTGNVLFWNGSQPCGDCNGSGVQPVQKGGDDA